MTYKLFLDDLRAPPDQTWVVVRTVRAAIEYVETYGLPLEMSLDHDLGDGERDAPAFLHWLTDYDMDHGYLGLENIGFNVHSANPAGRQNLEGFWNSYLMHLHVNEGRVRIIR